MLVFKKLYSKHTVMKNHLKNKETKRFLKEMNDFAN